LTQIFWTIVPGKTQFGKIGAARRILLFNNSSIQQGAKLAYQEREIFSSTSPSPSVSLADLCMAPRHSASALGLSTSPMHAL